MGTALLTRPLCTKRHDAEANTYGLPRGDRLRTAVRAVFRQQRLAVLRYLRTGRKKDFGDVDLPYGWPDWNDFQLGALKISERMTPLLRPDLGRRRQCVCASGRTRPAHLVRGQPAHRADDPDSGPGVLPEHEPDDQPATGRGPREDQGRVARRSGRQRGKRREAHQSESTASSTRPRNGGPAESRRTETSRAVHAAQEQAAIQSGVVTGWTWLLSADACPLCNTIARRAPAVRLGHAFAVIGSSAAYSQVRHPPAHPYCNCTLQEVLDTDEQPTWADTLHQPKPEEVDLNEPNVIPLSPTTSIPA